MLRLIGKGTRIFKDDDELHFYCGELNRSIADTSEAIKEYTMAMKLAKINGEDFYLVPFYYLNRGNIYLQNKQYNIALKDYSY